jgi:dimethylargininase
MKATRLIALTREVPASIARCELTHLERCSIDLERTRQEHALYQRTLADLGCDVRQLPANDELPDSVFVEDTVVALDEISVLTRPGAVSRRPEVAAMQDALRSLRPSPPLARIEAPGTLDGGDVLVLDKEIVVGLSARTNSEGASSLARHVQSLGYRVRTVAVEGCLHLKSAVTRVGPGTLLANPRWVDLAAFPGWQIVESDPGEPFAANALWFGGAVVHAAEFPATRTRLERAGCDVISVPAGELAKAEGGVTCCSVIVRLNHD